MLLFSIFQGMALPICSQLRCQIYLKTRHESESVSESLCFGNSLFKFKLHVSSWALKAGTGDSPHAFIVVNSFFMCGFLGSLPLSLPSQGGISRNTLSSVISTQDGRRNSLFTYFSFCTFFCGGDEFICGFCSMELLLVFFFFFFKFPFELDEWIEPQ